MTNTVQRYKYYSSKPYKTLERKDFNVFDDGECYCLVLNENDEEVKPPFCTGQCQELAMEQWEEDAKHFFFNYKHRYFISNFPTWQGNRDGEIIAKDAKDFIQQFIGRGNWHIWWMFHREPKAKDAKKYNDVTLRIIVAGHDGESWVTVTKDKKDFCSWTY